MGPRVKGAFRSTKLMDLLRKIGRGVKKDARKAEIALGIPVAHTKREITADDMFNEMVAFAHNTKNLYEILERADPERKTGSIKTPDRRKGLIKTYQRMLERKKRACFERTTANFEPLERGILDFAYSLRYADFKEKAIRDTANAIVELVKKEKRIKNNEKAAKEAKRMLSDLRGRMEIMERKGNMAASAFQREYKDGFFPGTENIFSTQVTSALDLMLRFMPDRASAA